MVELNSTDHIVTGLAAFTFDTTDYMVFVLILLISASIGVYFGFFAKGADTPDEYLLGNKQMKTVPIAVSLVASQLSAVSIMTIPAEMYAYGINMYFSVIAMVIVVPILCWIVIPVFYNNNISNCYEYLQIRFNARTRKLLTFSYVAVLVLMLPVFIFIPAMAFSQVTGLNVHIINVVVCSVCVFYTMVGGIKAVVWTDCIQAVIMLGSVIMVAILGVRNIGGLNEVVRRAVVGQRLHVNLEFDTTTRSTLWNCFISSMVMWTTYVGLNQSCVQRIVALPSLSHAKRSIQLFGIGFLIILSFTCFTGIIMYSQYHYCDPISMGYVDKPDKLMAYFVQDIGGHIKGMPGIFISSVFSAALSTMSANLNALSGIVYFDYVKPFIRHTESRANFIMKAFVLVAGVYSILGGWIVQQFTSIFQLLATISGLTMGAVFGAFFLGFLVPKAHGRAAFWATITSMVCMTIVIIGAQGMQHYKPLPGSLEGCEGYNTTMAPPTNTATLLSLSKQHLDEDTGFNIFKLSFYWYTVLGAIITFVVGIILSYILSPEKNSKFDPKLLSPIVHSFVKYELTEMEDLSEKQKRGNFT